jgi:hypothetical protein
MGDYFAWESSLATEDWTQQKPFQTLLLPRMVLLMDFTEMRVRNVRINLRRVDGSMAEESLNAAQVGAIRKQIGRENVAKGMGRHFRCDAGLSGVRLDMALHVARRDAVKLRRSPVDEEGFFHVLAGLQILRDRGFGGRGEEDDAHLLALAAHRKVVAR